MRKLSTELDLVPGIGTFVLCLTLPIELGILTGVIVNIIFILYHAARPKFSVEMLKVRNYDSIAGHGVAEINCVYSANFRNVLDFYQKHNEIFGAP